MSPTKKNGKISRNRAAAKPAKKFPLEQKLNSKILWLLKSDLSSEEILGRFAGDLRRLFSLEAVSVWYWVQGSEFRLFMSTSEINNWFDHMPPVHAGLEEFVQGTDKQAINLRGQDFANAQSFYDHFSLKPILVSAFSIGEAGKNLLVCELLSGKKALARQHLDMARAAAVELMLVVKNAQLENMNRKESEENRLLLEISRILNSTLNPKVVRTRSMESVVRLLDCEAGSLYLIDEAKGELYFEVALGERGDQVKEIRLKIGEGVAGWVAQTGESVLVTDAAKDPRWASKADKKSKFQTRNMVTVPVKAGGKIIGVLQALNKLGGKVFDQHDLGLMESLADSGAIALENALLHDEQRRTFFETAEALADAIEKRDPYTGGHTQRVRDFSGAIGRELALDKDFAEKLDLAAILHDIGKIGVEDRVLRKPGRLTDEEFALMSLHPEHGFSILSHVKSLEKVIPGMRHHHERLDGKGYPLGLKGSEIPRMARIISVADTWDAMTSDRPYRPALGEDVAIKELWNSRAKQLDEEMVVAFFRAYKKKRIYTQHRSKEAELPAAAMAVLTSIADENKLEL
jgi:HD-GYP domain-containing protein (c-di-GMP phosphodiesterase class II)